jgi:hypothetical protein
MNKKSPERIEFNNMKKRAWFWALFGGHDKEREIHHKKGLAESKDNSPENLVSLKKAHHRLFHKLKNAGETDDIMFRGKKPSDESVVYDLGGGCLDKHLKKEAMQDVINDLKSRGR